MKRSVASVPLFMSDPQALKKASGYTSYLPMRGCGGPQGSPFELEHLSSPCLYIEGPFLSPPMDSSWSPGFSHA